MLVYLIAFLGLTSSLLGADQFAGTWKLNVAKSELPPAPAGKGLKEQAIVVEQTSDMATVTITGTREDDSATPVVKYSTPMKGGVADYSEGAPPAGVSVTTKRIDERTIDIITTRDGKVVGTSHVTVSSDGKTMRQEVKGTDPQAKSYERVIVFEKQ